MRVLLLCATLRSRILGRALGLLGSGVGEGQWMRLLDFHVTYEMGMAVEKGLHARMQVWLGRTVEGRETCTYLYRLLVRGQLDDRSVMVDLSPVFGTNGLSVVGKMGVCQP